MKASQSEEQGRTRLPAAPAVDEPDTAGRHFSGVVAVTRPEELDRWADRVNALEQVEVHMRHQASGRLVAVLEGASVAENEATLERIRSLPGIMMAALVYHYVDEGEDKAPVEGQVVRQAEVKA